MPTDTQQQLPSPGDVWRHRDGEFRKIESTGSLGSVLQLVLYSRFGGEWERQMDSDEWAEWSRNAVRVWPVAETPPQSGNGEKTIRVRAAVIATREGSDWMLAGSSYWDDDRAIEFLEDRVKNASPVAFIEADIPVPSTPTIEGKAEPQP